MNWIVISIGTALVLALVAALVGPMLVDWTAYRATIEANAERFLGTEVSIDGDAELRILPSPRLRLTNLRLGSAAAPQLIAEQVELDVELMPLLSREFHVQDLRVISPVATVSIDENGGLAVPEMSVDQTFTSIFDGGSVVVENVTVENGTLQLNDRRTGSRETISAIFLTGSARSLRGPFTAAGHVDLAGGRHGLRIAGGALEGGTMPLSVRVEPPAEGAEIRFEGAVVPRTTAPSMRGRLTVRPGAASPWFLEGTLLADPNEVSLAGGTVRHLIGGTQIELAASAAYLFAGDQPASLALEARQLDIDRISRALSDVETGETRAPRETVADLARVFAPIFALAKEREGIAIPMVAELNVGTVVMGEAVIRDVSVEARTTPDGLAMERIEALLPGETSVMASAVAEEDLRGTVNLLSSQPAALARWWTGGAFAAGTIEPVMVEADIRTSGEGFGAQRLALRLGQSRASGRIEYASHGTEPPLLTLKMTAPRLSLDDLLDAGALVGAAGVGLADAPNIQLNVLVNEAIIGTVAGATVSLNATYNDGRLTIDALSADDLAGAEVFASGEIVDLMSEPVGTVRGRVRVEDGEALAGALASVDTGVADLARFVPALTPADLRVNLSGQTGEDGEDLSLSVIGEAGGTALNVSAAGLSAGGDILAQPVSLNVSAENSDAAELLRQIGVAAVGSAPAGSIRLALDGTPRERMMGTARVDLLGVEATFEGDMRVGERIAPSGELAVSVNDQSTLETALGVSFPQLTPLSLTATLAPGFAGAVRAAPVAGTAAEMPFDADLELAAGRVTGSLAIAEADLLALTSLVLGGEAWTATSDGGSWPRSIFAPSIWPAYNAALSVDAGRLKVGDDIIANASLDVALGRDRLAVENLRGAWSGGTVLAGFGIDRDGSSARLSCDFTLENIDLSGNAWRGGAEAITSGRLDLTAEFAGSGTTVEGLVADLSGRGDVAVRDAVVRGLNITGPEAVVEPLLSTASPTEDRTRAAFEAHLSASDLSVESLTAKLSVNDGTMRVEAVEGDSALADAIGPTALDMADWRIRSDWSIDLDTAGDGEAVAVGLTFDGAADAPERTVDVAGLTTWLNLRQLERQIETVEEENEALGAAGDDVPPVVEGNFDVRSPEGTAPDRDVLDASQDENDGAEDAGDLRGGENEGGANGDGAPLGDGVIRRRPIPIPSPDRAPGGAQEGWLGHPAASVRFAALP